MIKNFVRLALHRAHNVIESLDDRIHSFDSKFFKQRELVNDIEHVDDFLNSLAESIKLPKYVHFRKVKLLFFWCFLKFFLQKIERQNIQIHTLMSWKHR